MKASPDSFRCRPLSALLSVERCAQMHVEAEARASASPGTFGALRNASCRGCEVGSAHARGSAPLAWPDGSSLERVDLGVGLRRSAKDNAPSRGAEEDVMPRALAIVEVRGKRLGQSGWAKELGCSEGTVSGMKKRFGSAEKAIEHLLDNGLGAGSRTPKAPSKDTHATRKRHVRVRRRRAGSAARATKAAEIDRALNPVELLRLAGFEAEEAGRVPRGQLVLIADPS